MVIQKVKGLLAGVLGIEQDEVTSKMTLTNDSGVDPIDLASLIIACERAFKLTIHDEDVLQLKTVSDLAAYIDRMIDEGFVDTPEVTEADRTAWFYE